MANQTWEPPEIKKGDDLTNNSHNQESNDIPSDKEFFTDKSPDDLNPEKLEDVVEKDTITPEEIIKNTNQNINFEKDDTLISKEMEDKDENKQNNSEIEEKLKDVNKRIEKELQRINELEQEENRLKSEINNLDIDIKETETAIEDLNHKKESAINNKEEKKTKLQEVKEEIDNIKNKIEEIDKLLG